MGVYGGRDSSLLNMTKFFLTNYLLYDFILRDHTAILLSLFFNTFNAYCIKNDHI